MPGSTHTLAELVARRRYLLERLLVACGKQGELVGAGDTTELLKLLGAKQTLIDGLRETEQLLDPFRGEDPATRHWASQQARATCAADAEQCSRLLAAVRQLEEKHGRQMAERRDVIADQLQTIHRGHQVATAYQPHAVPGAGVAKPAIAPTTPVATNLDLSTH
ncbi:MAG: flagellar export chaperone FlgN [Planctomycetota bacterium]